jgi:hypothetical protein
LAAATEVLLRNAHGRSSDRRVDGAEGYLCCTASPLTGSIDSTTSVMSVDSAAPCAWSCGGGSWPVSLSDRRHDGIPLHGHGRAARACVTSGSVTGQGCTPSRLDQEVRASDTSPGGTSSPFVDQCCRLVSWPVVEGATPEVGALTTPACCRGSCFVVGGRGSPSRLRFEAGLGHNVFVPERLGRPGLAEDDETRAPGESVPGPLRRG